MIIRNPYVIRVDGENFTILGNLDTTGLVDGFMHVFPPGSPIDVPTIGLDHIPGTDCFVERLS